MRFVEKLRSKIVSFLRNQNLIKLKGSSFIHPSVVIRSSVISGEFVAGEGTKIIDGVTIIADSPITIGKFTTINGPNSDLISAVNPIVIGSFCSIARSVSIQEYHHRFDRASSYFISRNLLREGIANDIYSQGSIQIGNDVWIGAQCVVLSGAKIGDGAIIGANSTVLGEIPPYAVAVGSPAKVVKYRFRQEIITGLLGLKWWDWPMDKIRDSKHFFLQSLTEEALQEMLRRDEMEK